MMYIAGFLGVMLLVAIGASEKKKPLPKPHERGEPR
jgi:hypothetical protein